LISADNTGIFAFGTYFASINELGFDGKKANGANKREKMAAVKTIYLKPRLKTRNNALRIYL
jgi:hypothetical protein